MTRYVPTYTRVVHNVSPYTTYLHIFLWRFYRIRGLFLLFCYVLHDVLTAIAVEHRCYKHSVCTMKEVVFYYDLVCPFAYMASRLIEGVAQRTGARIQWKPVLLGKLSSLSE